MDKLYWNINELKPYDKNARQSNPEDMARLKEQIQKLGQYKPLLIESSGIVLGGNHRLQIYKELGMEQVWVSVVEFVQIEEIWYAVVNGDKQEKGFPDKESAMMEYALSDNDRAAHYDEEQLKKYISELSINTDIYAADLLDPTHLKDLEGQVTGSQPEDGDGELQTTEDQTLKKYKLMVVCDDEISANEIKKLIEEKYPYEIKIKEINQ